MKNRAFTNIWSVCLLTLLCCFLWGSAFPCIKVGYRLFQVGSADYLSQILFAGVRFTLAGLLVILFGSISTTLSGRNESSPKTSPGEGATVPTISTILSDRNESSPKTNPEEGANVPTSSTTLSDRNESSPKTNPGEGATVPTSSTTLSGSAEKTKKLLFPAPSSWIMIINLSFLQTMIQYTFFYIGMAHTPGVKASILTGTNVFLSVLVAALIFKLEKLTARKLLGCFVGFAGIIVINLTGLGSAGFGFTLLGEGFILMSAVSHAFSSVAMKTFSRRENPVTLSGYQFLLGGLVMTIVSFLLGGRIHPTGVGCFVLLIYMAMISAVAYTLWSILLKYNPVSRIAVFRFANPLFGALLSALILGTTSGISVWQALVSLLLVCGGIVIVNTCPSSGRSCGSKTLY